MEQQGNIRSSLDNQTYFDAYLPLPLQPPQSQTLPERILDSLKMAGSYNDNTWVNIPQQPKDGDEVIGNDTNKGLVEVLESVRALTEKNLTNFNRVPGKWVDTHDVALQTWSRSGVSGLRPDISFVHGETHDNEVSSFSAILK
jgi:hypothetical protein